MTADIDRAKNALLAYAEEGRGYEPLPVDALAVLDALDQADARIARLTAQTETRRRAVAIYQQRAREAEARIKAVRDVHRQFGVYEHEDACPDTTDEHRDAHHHEDSDGYGEKYCDQRPLYTLCDHCRDESGERADWPCATIRALDGTVTTDPA